MVLLYADVIKHTESLVEEKSLLVIKFIAQFLALKHLGEDIDLALSSWTDSQIKM